MSSCMKAISSSFFSLSPSSRTPLMTHKRHSSRQMFRFCKRFGDAIASAVLSSFSALVLSLSSYSVKVSYLMGLLSLMRNMWPWFIAYILHEKDTLSSQTYESLGVTLTSPISRISWLEAFKFLSFIVFLSRTNLSIEMAGIKFTCPSYVSGEGDLDASYLCL